MSKNRYFFMLLFLLVVVKAEPTLTESQAWGYGFLVGFGVSLIGFLAAFILICFQKCMDEECFRNFINMLYALSCGALLGDSAIHILPAAYSNDSTTTNYISLVFICSIAFFILLERVFQACGIAHKHWGDDQSHSHQTQHKNQSKKQQGLQNQPALQLNKGVTETQILKDGLISENKIGESELHLPPKSQGLIINNAEEQNITAEKSSTIVIEEKGCLQNLKGKGTAGYLNLLSSFIHNLFDGLSLGVAFSSQDRAVFVPMIIAIVAHEIPRQMGDVGILFKSGFSNTQTVLCNGCINFLSLIGVLIGLGIGSMNQEAQNYIMTFVAGNFIYIAADIWKNLLKNKKKIMNFVQFLFFSIGVGLMFLVLLAESE